MKIVKAGMIIFIFWISAVSGKEQTRVEYDVYELENFCRQLDRRFELAFPCSFNTDLQTFDVILYAKADRQLLLMEADVICTIAIHLALAETDNFRTNWELAVFSMSSPNHVKTCQLSYIQKLK